MRSLSTINPYFATYHASSCSYFPYALVYDRNGYICCIAKKGRQCATRKDVYLVLNEEGDIVQRQEKASEKVWKQAEAGGDAWKQAEAGGDVWKRA